MKPVHVASAAVAVTALALGAAGCSGEESSSTKPAVAPAGGGSADSLPDAVLGALGADKRLTETDLDCRSRGFHFGGFRQVNEITGHVGMAPRLSPAASSIEEAANAWPRSSPLDRVYVLDKPGRSAFNVALVRPDESIAGLVRVGNADGDWYVEGYASCDRVPGQPEV